MNSWAWGQHGPHVKESVSTLTAKRWAVWWKGCSLESQCGVLLITVPPDVETCDCTYLNCLEMSRWVAESLMLVQFCTENEPWSHIASWSWSHAIRVASSRLPEMFLPSCIHSLTLPLLGCFSNLHRVLEWIPKFSQIWTFKGHVSRYLLTETKTPQAEDPCNSPPFSF